MIKILKSRQLYLSIIILVALMVRLLYWDVPIADWHSWRQADTASVSRNFVKVGFNPFFPRDDDMSGVSEHPIPNLNRFRFVEFPVYNLFVYPFYYNFGVWEKYSRLVSILFSLGSIYLLFMIVRRYLEASTAFVSSLLFSFLPFSVYFSRTTLPEPTFLFFALGMFYFVDLWIYKNTKGLLLASLIFSVIAFLIKPWAIFFALPLVYSIYKREGKLWPFTIKYVLFAAFVLVPFLLWRLWILNHPEGIPASNWLMNGDGIRFKPAFWWWLISERIGREILGVAGAVLFFLGMVIKPAKNYLLHFWALSMFLYFIIFATGNVRHDYYQYIFVPVACVFTSWGFVNLVKGLNNFVPRIWTIILAAILLPLTFYFSFLQVKGLYQINNWAIVHAGQKANQILPKNAVVVAPLNGDTAFLYQINRPGWPVQSFPITEMISDYGVTSYISTANDVNTAWIKRHFQVLVDDSEYVIVDLTKVTKSLNDPKDPEI